MGRGGECIRYRTILYARLLMQNNSLPSRHVLLTQNSTQNTPVLRRTVSCWHDYDRRSRAQTYTRTQKTHTHTETHRYCAANLPAAVPSHIHTASCDCPHGSAIVICHLTLQPFTLEWVTLAQTRGAIFLTYNLAKYVSIFTRCDLEFGFVFLFCLLPCKFSSVLFRHTAKLHAVKVFVFFFVAQRPSESRACCCLELRD